MIVGNQRKACSIGEPEGHRSRVPRDVRGASQGTALRRGSEGSADHGTFSMGRPKTGMYTEHNVKLGEQIVGELDNSFAGWKRHLVLLYGPLCLKDAVIMSRHCAANRQPLPLGRCSPRDWHVSAGAAGFAEAHECDFRGIIEAIYGHPVSMPTDSTRDRT